MICQYIIYYLTAFNGEIKEEADWADVQSPTEKLFGIKEPRGNKRMCFMRNSHFWRKELMFLKELELSLAKYF